MRTVTLKGSVQAEIVAQARREAPHECCGLLLGSGSIVDECVPVRNVSRTPATRYEIDPAAHIAARRRLRGSAREVIGCYHSHPASAAVPSATDIAGAYYPEFVWVIVSLADPAHPGVAAYRLADGRSTSLRIVIDSA